MFSSEILKAFETVPDLYLILSPELTILTASNAYLNAFFTTRVAIAGQPLFNAFPETWPISSNQDCNNLKASLQEVLQTKKPSQMAVQQKNSKQAYGESIKSTGKLPTPRF